MVRSRITRSLLLILTALVLTALATGCSSVDEVAPSAAFDAPDTIFINTSGNEFVRLEGSASDNVKITMVEASLDNGTSFPYATTAIPSGSTVAWDIPVPGADFSVPNTTIVVRATDGESNTGLSTASVVDVVKSAAPLDLTNLVAGAATGDVIVLSSGTGSAYDISLQITRALTLRGYGVGDTATAGGYPAWGDSHGTVLSAANTDEYILSADAGLTLTGIRFTGGVHGIKVADNVITTIDIPLTLEDCLFEDQGAWSILTEDPLGNIADDIVVTILDSGVDASQAASTDAGGMWLKDSIYDIDNIGVRGAVASSGYYAGILVEAGSGTIQNSAFADNALAIWASGSDANVVSCSIMGSVSINTAGINLTGDSAPDILNNEVAFNSGYGLRISGSATPHVRGNVLHDNQGAGIVIDFMGSAAGVGNIDLGTTSDKGNNDLFDNQHPINATDVQVYVTTATPVGRIPAEWNYWGFVTANEVNVVIVDGNDPGRSSGFLDPSPFWTSAQN